MDGLKPSVKEVTAKERKENSNRRLQARLADYLQKWQDGGEDGGFTAADHFRGQIHSDRCVPFCCSGALCPTRRMPRHNADCSSTGGCDELCGIRQALARPTDSPALYYPRPGPLSQCVDFINVWALAQVHLAALAREQPQRLAYIGSLSEADEVLSLLSLHFKVPVLSPDLDFAVSGYGQMNVFYLFQQQFQLKEAHGKATFERDPDDPTGWSNKTLLRTRLKNHLEVKYPNQLAWLPLILGCDFGPPDGRVWDLVKGLFLEDDHQVRLHFEQAARCFPALFDPWTEEGKDFDTNWRERMRPYRLSIENLRFILKHLPNPTHLMGFMHKPVQSGGKLDPSVFQVLMRNRSHMDRLSNRLHQCNGPGVLMLLRDSMHSRLGPDVPFSANRNGILLCLGLYNVGVHQMGTYAQKNYLNALEEYLRKCPVDGDAPWCIMSDEAPPPVTRHWATKPRDHGTRSKTGSGRLPDQGQALPQGQHPPKACHMRWRANAVARPEEGPDSAAGPGPAPSARCQCIHAPYLVQPLLQGFPHLRLFVQAFYMAFPRETPKQSPAMLPIFRRSLNSLGGKQETSMPPLPQYDILKGGGTVWDWTRQARLLLYFLLSRGPEGVYNGSKLCRMDEHQWPAASVAKACQGNAHEVETKSYHLGKHLEGELDAVLQMVDSILKTERAGGLDRLLLAGVLLSTKWARDVSANFDKRLLCEMIDLCSSDHRARSRIVQNLELPGPVRRHALAILGESPCLASCKLQEAAGNVILHCLGVMVHRALGDVEHARAEGGLPSPTQLTAFSLKLAALCSWLDLYSVLSGRQLSLLMQACASSAGRHAFPHSQSPPRREGQLPLTQSEVANALLDVLRQTSL
ncbi:hypothetical protein, variant [Fonticula alba]|nr:hypothetical protein, variant [Fonticula alba]KCV67962.1 hypothetical protein, variant [Fonticula alba]|eukprot:XP_009497529.1 hypothetical protein, variant [Fonticula alba]